MDVVRHIHFYTTSCYDNTHYKVNTHAVIRPIHNYSVQTKKMHSTLIVHLVLQKIAATISSVNKISLQMVNLNNNSNRLPRVKMQRRYAKYVNQYIKLC